MKTLMIAAAAMACAASLQADLITGQTGFTGAFSASNTNLTTPNDLITITSAAMGGTPTGSFAGGVLTGFTPGITLNGPGGNPVIAIQPLWTVTVGSHVYTFVSTSDSTVTSAPNINTIQGTGTIQDSFDGDTAIGTYNLSFTAAGGVAFFWNASSGSVFTIGAPILTTLAASSIAATNATLNGTVNPNGAATTAYFRYGLTTNYGSLSGVISNPSFESNSYTVIPGYASGNGGTITGWTISNTNRIGLNPYTGGSLFANNGDIPDGTNVAFIQSSGDTNTLSTTLSNLVIGTTYVASFRANCRSGYGAPNATRSLNGGPFVPFTASPAVGGTNPYYANSGTFTATAGTAVLALQNSTPTDSTVLLDDFSVSTIHAISSLTNLPATSTNLAVSIPISGLQPATTYYFQMVATNIAGTSLGGDLTFTTGSSQPLPFNVRGSMQLSGGAFQLSFTNLSGLGFSVLGSTSLALPLTNWTLLGPAAESPAGSGNYQFTDPQASNYPNRFYRVRSP